jgi:hypothetical protein
LVRSLTRPLPRLGQFRQLFSALRFNRVSLVPAIAVLRDHLGQNVVRELDALEPMPFVDLEKAPVHKLRNCIAVHSGRGQLCARCFHCQGSAVPAGR